MFVLLEPTNNSKLPGTLKIQILPNGHGETTISIRFSMKKGEIIQLKQPFTNGGFRSQAPGSSQDYQGNHLKLPPIPPKTYCLLQTPYRARGSARPAPGIQKPASPNITLYLRCTQKKVPFHKVIFQPLIFREKILQGCRFGPESKPCKPWFHQYLSP